LTRAVWFSFFAFFGIGVELHSRTLLLVAKQFAAADPSEVCFVKNVKGPAAYDSIELAVLLGQAPEQLPLLFVFDMLMKELLAELTLFDWKVLCKVKPVPVRHLFLMQRLLVRFRLFFLSLFARLSEG